MKFERRDDPLASGCVLCLISQVCKIERLSDSTIPLDLNEPVMLVKVQEVSLFG